MGHLMPSFRTLCALSCATIMLLCSATALSVERIKPDDHSGGWLVEGYKIYVEVPCRVSTTSLLPTKQCTQPYIVIEQSRNSEPNTFSESRPFFNLVVGDISIGEKWKFDGSNDPMKQVRISDAISGTGPQKSHELFALLMSAPATPLKIKLRSREDGDGSSIRIRTVVLADFETKTSELIRDVNQRYDHEESERRRNMLIGLSLIGGMLTVVLWLLFFLLRRGRIRLQVVKQGFEMKRVARIAEDEAIRELVRNSVQKADENQLDVLRSQIKAALDAGDTETAEKLLSVLKKSHSPA